MGNFCNVDLILEQLNTAKDNIDKYYRQKGTQSFSRSDYEDTVKIEENLSEMVLSLREKTNENYFSFERKPIENESNVVDFSLRKTLLNSVKVKEKGSIIKIEMPPLLHKKVYCEVRKDEEYFENYYTNTLIDNDLYSVLRNFKRREKISKFSEKVLIYIKNVVSIEGTIKNIPDTDNHEYHDVINTISTVFLEDDSPEQAAFLCDTVVGNENKTCVYIVPYKTIIGPLSEAINIRNLGDDYVNENSEKVIKVPFGVA